MSIKERFDEWVTVGGPFQIIASIGFFIGIPSLVVWGFACFKAMEKSEPYTFWVSLVGVGCLLVGWFRHISRSA